MSSHSGPCILKSKKLDNMTSNEKDGEGQCCTKTFARSETSVTVTLADLPR